MEINLRDKKRLQQQFTRQTVCPTEKPGATPENSFIGPIKDLLAALTDKSVQI